jgi:hypothetical protein
MPGEHDPLDAPSKDGPEADGESTAERRRRRRRLTPPRDVMASSQINGEIWLSILPIAAFLLVDRVADTRVAIGAGFAAAVIGDFLWTGAFLGSVVIGRPLMGVFVREMFPGVKDWISERHQVFITLSLAWAVQNVVTAVIRLILLDSLSTDSYILWSRVATWPLNIGLFAISYYLVWRAIHREAERRVSEESAAGPEA